MTDSVVPFGRPLYVAKRFAAGMFEASGTLCGHIDLTGTWLGTCVLSPDEALALIAILQQAREDVLQNSDPLNDPRLTEDRSQT